MLHKILPPGQQVTLVMPERVEEIMSQKQFRKLIDKKSKGLFEDYVADALGPGLTDLIKEKGTLDWTFIGNRAADIVALKLKSSKDIRGHLDYVSKNDVTQRDNYLLDFSKILVQDGS